MLLVFPTVRVVGVFSVEVVVLVVVVYVDAVVAVVGPQQSVSRCDLLLN